MVLTFRRSVPLHSASTSSTGRHSSGPSHFTHTNRQSNSNGYHDNNSRGGYHGARGRGYGGYNRYNNHESGMSAASQLRQQMHGQQPQRSRVPVFAASATTAAHASQQQPLSDKQEISEPATVIWSEDGFGEVMSPTVWRSRNLHVYFDATSTTAEAPGGWEGLTKELHSGVEMDISYTLPRALAEAMASDERREEEEEEEGEEGEEREETHTFICITSIADPSAHPSLLTHEQSVVIGRRSSNGATFLINSCGERSVLHPHFLPLDGVRQAIREKTQGRRKIATNEMEASVSSLCVIGRSLAVRLVPVPSWLRTIFDCDRGVTRWALTADVYGEEKRGRAVVVRSTRHSVTLCPVEGELAGKRTSLHAPIIQMNGQIKHDLQQAGSCWRFRACREFPGREAVWRAFHVEEELPSDPPLSESVIASAVSGNRLISLEDEEELVDPLWEGEGRTEEEKERREKEEQERRGREGETSELDELAQLQLVFAQQPFAAPAAAAAVKATPTAAPAQLPSLISEADDDEILVYESIDDILDSDTFAADVFRAPAVLKNEWLLLGVPPEEALKTNHELLHAAVPRVLRGEEERQFGVFRMGDERPDMRVLPKKKKRRRRYRMESDDEGRITPVEGAPMGGRDSLLEEAPGGSQLHEAQKEGATATDEQRAREKRREAKEDYKLKKHLESIAVSFATDGDDFFNLLHGSVKPAAAPAAAAATTARESSQPSSPPPAAPAAAAEAPVRAAATSRNELFELFHGAAPTAAAAATVASSRPASAASAAAAKVAAPSSQPVVLNSATTGNDLFDLLHTGASTSGDWRVEEEKERGKEEEEEEEEKRETTAAAAAAEEARAASPAPSSYSSPLLVVADEPLPTRPRAPRFAILPYPERPRYADGWWFRPSRPRPAPVESRKEARKKRRAAEEAWKRQHEREEEEKKKSAPASDTDASRAYERPRPPADDMRARLLGALQKKKEDEQGEKPTEAATDASHAFERRAPADDMRARLLGGLQKKKEEQGEKPTEVATDASRAFERRAPADDMRARLLGALQKKREEQKPVEPLAVVTATVEKAEEWRRQQERKEQEEEWKGATAAVENVLVDLTPSSDFCPPSPTAAAAADSAHSQLTPPPLMALHDDLRGLF